ncbi:MAG: MFS transporter [Ruminococcaceae bacterium]|nr:MFS transporter [Oscillospiraceae bacterium]
MKANKLTFKHTIYASYLGYITQAIVNNLAPLLFLIFKDSFGIPLGKITLLITVNFFVQLAVDFAASKAVDKAGYKPSVVTAHILCAAGLIMLAVMPQICKNSFAGLLAAVVVYAVGGGLIEVLISPIVEACPSDNKASAMSLLHSFYCWGCVLVITLSTLFLHFAGKDRWQLLAVLWALLPLFNAVFFALVPINTLTGEGKGMSYRELFSHGGFLLLIIMMVCSGASEQSMSQWASALAESGLGVSKVAGDLAGPCMFAVLMGSARVIGAKLTNRVSLSLMMCVSGVICIASYLITSLSVNPVVSLAGCAICGFSVGIMWPATFSVASEKFTRGGTAMFALLALAGDLGCMGGPTIVGEISATLSDNLKSGMLVAAVFPAVLVVCVLLGSSKKFNPR